MITADAHSDQQPREVIDFAAEGWFGPELSALLRAWGREYHRADSRLERRWRALSGPKKACFQTSAQLALDYPDELTYVEGYAFADIPIALPLAHAWLIDDNGRVVDPTWSGGSGYFGLALSTAELAEYLAISEQYGILDSLWSKPELRQVFLSRWPLSGEGS